ncbi:MAG TPA: carboxylesterase family protein, partial [Puia sp.]|nr:carboxylesterase family protein [Puia sp.]
MLVIQPKKTIFLFLLPITVVGFSQTQKFPEVIKVDGGLISGTNNLTKDIHVYKGIPFAAPPINNLRWREPQPVIAWSGIKKCDAFSASPMQSKPVPFGVYTKEFLIPESPISEDCLYLNIWTGAKSSSEKRPVIVWIYGGGFVSGGTACPIYDGEAMAKKGIVFVSINYRVGVFGFFAHPELTKESGHNASGNYGLMDQIAALKWVKKNIAAFGGNPDNVTIAGQSAGAVSVNELVASPLCKGLFEHAIAESGAAFINGMIHTGTLKQAEEDGSKIAQSFQATSINDLRKISAEELLMKAWGGGTIVDGYVLPDPIANIFAAGKQNDVDVITGWNDDDAFIGSLKNAEDFKKEAKEKYGNDAETFLKYYP